MVFSSVPLYLDPPNWQQHPNHHHHQQQQHQQVIHHGVNQGNENHLIQSTNIQPPPSHMGGGPGGAPPIRPNSMAERARLAKIPPPEAPLKCPRCDSTNTKFCYFNNYSLSQPRHFCKTCRRYWTRGGALRNVPVGGGCRRNKRSSSKSSTGGSGGGGGISTSSSKPSISSPTAGVGLGGGMDMVGTAGVVPTIAGIPTAGGGGGMTSFMASLQNMAQLGMGNLGLTFGGSLHAPHALSDHQHQHPQLDFNVSGLLNQHAPHVHFPSALGGVSFDLPPAPGGGAGGGSTNLYSSFSADEVVGRGGVGGGNDNDDNHQQQQQMNDNNNNLPKSCSSTIMSQLAPVKMEGQGQRLNLVKQLMMGISSTTSSENNNNQFWGSGIVGNTSGGITNMWTDLSGLNSSSTSHLM